MLPIKTPFTAVLTILSSTTTGTTCTDSTYTITDNTAQHNSGTACNDPTYSSAANTVQHNHWYNLYKPHLQFYWQYCPAQPLVLPEKPHLQFYIQYCPKQPLILPVQTPLTVLLTILSSTTTRIAYKDPTYSSTDNTVQHNHWYCL